MCDWAGVPPEIDASPPAHTGSLATVGASTCLSACPAGRVACSTVEAGVAFSWAAHGVGCYAHPVDWVYAVGYRHEVIHSGVLEVLLSDAESGPRVAQDLLGDGHLQVDVVCSPRREARIGPARRRPIDLAADLKLSDGATVSLGVEVKVDSAWSPSQLESTVALHDQGVLLAVGCTALTATGPEMPRGWRLVGAEGMGVDCC